MAGTKFETIVADPPWKFPRDGLWQRSRSRARAKYKTLDPDEIAQLPVRLIVNRPSVLFLWVPAYHLINGFHLPVVWSWGFRPIGGLIYWCKTTKDGERRIMGLGKYTRGAGEPVVVAVAGTPDLGTIPTYFTGVRRAHSVKPQEFFDLITSETPEPRLELFAREKREGWTSWGREVGDPLDWGFDPGRWMKR